MLPPASRADSPVRPRWGLALRRIHAVSALVVVTAIGLGLAMTHLVSDAGLRFDLYQMHKSFGMLALLLVLLRIIVRLGQEAPEPVGSFWQRRLAALVHKGIYLLLLIMPACGWAMVSASPLPVPTVIFGLWILPSALKPDFALYQALKTTHSLLGWTFCALLLLHLAGAVAHWKSGIVSAMWRLRHNEASQ